MTVSWLTGPIFEKELRVSSRRRRNYVLRFAYLILLMVFLALFWFSLVPRTGSGVYQASQMAEAGKGLTAFVVWFQFIATQIVALIMLSTSISDEVYQRTLGVLMTTPINSFQIVIGKLFSKLLQIVLLLGISLPLLAIVRVFGGVPWMFLISCLCINLTAVIFVGSLALFFSVFSRRAYVVIIETILIIGLLFLLLPYLSAFLWNAMTGSFPGPRLTGALFFPNPYGFMMFRTMAMLEPRAAAGIPVMLWPAHCAIMLAASASILFLSVLLVRRAGLRQAAGPSRMASARTTIVEKGKAISPATVAKPRRVSGPPVIWKELRAPVFGRRKIRTIIAIAAGLILLFMTYALCASEDMLDENGVHMAYVIIFSSMGILFTIVLPATCVTSEKESQAWPLLMATTLSDWQILFGKLAGIVRRCAPIWSLAFGHIIIFTLAGQIHPAAILHMGILAAWLIAFLSGTGMYFSTRFKHTTSAVIANFALAATIWAVVPIMLGLIVGIVRGDPDILEGFIDLHPLVHAGIAIDGAMHTAHRYDWPGTDSLNIAQSTLWMLICMVGYMFLGFLFMWRAKNRFRRSIF